MNIERRRDMVSSFAELVRNAKNEGGCERMIMLPSVTLPGRPARRGGALLDLVGLFRSGKISVRTSFLDNQP